MMLHYAPSQIDKREINGDSRNDSERERERALAEAESLVEKELEGAIRVEGYGLLFHHGRER